MATPRPKTYPIRTRISTGTIEGIREVLRNGPKTVRQVAEAYYDLVPWSLDEHKKPVVTLQETQTWAQDHLQHMCRKSNRIAFFENGTYRIA